MNKQTNAPEAIYAPPTSSKLGHNENKTCDISQRNLSKDDLWTKTRAPDKRGYPHNIFSYFFIKHMLCTHEKNLIEVATLINPCPVE